MRISQVLHDAIRNKSKLHRQWISSKNVLNASEAENIRQAYIKARNKVKAMIRKSKTEFERNIDIQSKSNPKIFWSHFHSNLKTKTGVAPLLQGEKDETSTKFDNKENTNILQKQFVSVFTKEPNAEVPVLDKKTEVNLPNTIITEEMARKEILKLNVNRSCGHDEIHLQILIELVDLVSKPLALVLNKTMDEGCIPQDGKWRMFHQYLRKELEIKQSTIDL